ncbi:hypothetical protein D3C75_1176740 [compost metagenome]
MHRPCMRRTLGVGVTQPVDRKRGGATEIAGKHLEDVVFRTHEAVGVQVLPGAAPQRGLYACTHAQRRQRDDGAGQRQERGPCLRVGHRTGTVHVQIQVHRFGSGFTAGCQPVHTL